MKITIVCGFFLPVPPEAGGALEKMWWRIARHYGRHGHTVTIISRRWRDWPHDETRDGVSFLRLPGANHRARLWQNLLLDAVWGWRVLRVLPPADILITNTVALPIFVRRFRPDAGLLVVNLNRFPKGQIRWYQSASRIQAASSSIKTAAIQQAPALANRINVVPNSIDCRRLSDAVGERSQDPSVLIIGFMGRIHPEKGLHTLVLAARKLEARLGLPPWRIVLRGPLDVPRGGGGEAYLRHLQSLAPELWQRDRIALADPLFNEQALAQAYRDLDVFCYPTEAAEGEAHPVAVLEAMACGLPVVCTDLPVFRDQLQSGRNALIVPLSNPDKLCEALAQLLGNTGLRQTLGTTAQETVSTLDDEVIAAQHLADYESLLNSAHA